MLDSGFDTFFKGVKIIHSGSFCLLLLCLCMLLQHIDIDECADRNMSACSQLCVNSVGSYRCECEKGYFLEEDGQTCTKGERGETSLFSSCFPFYPKKTDGVFSPADIWEPLHSPASCGFLLWFSGCIRVNVTNGSDYDRVSFCPRFSHCSRGEGNLGGCRFATSSHEFIFHYHIFRNDWRVETPRYALVLGYFLLICNSGDTSASKVETGVNSEH